MGVQLGFMGVQLGGKVIWAGSRGGVADVVQPRRGFQEIGVRAENGCQAACPGGDALDVGPAAGQGLLQDGLGEMFGP
jgi:hypothetical protein